MSTNVFYEDRAFKTALGLEPDETHFVVRGVHEGDDPVHGGCIWEFTITEDEVPGAMRVRVFDDAFMAFVDAREFFAGLAELPVANPETVRELMLNLGFSDVTPTAIADV